MDAPDLSSEAFWENSRPLVFSDPRLDDQRRCLEDLLAGVDWARNGVVFASSGSTGAPKWVLLRKAALLASAAMVNRHLAVQPADHWMLALPQWHVGGFGVAARSYEAGCQLSEFEAPWDPNGFAECITNCGATCTSLVPTQVHDLVQAKVTVPESLRAVVVGGGRLDDEVGGLARVLGWPVLQSYGMSEAGSQVATASLESLEEKFSSEALPILSGWELGLTDEGCLQIRGEALFDGYVTHDAGVFQLDSCGEGAWFTTKDLVTLSAGRLTFVGRIDRTVKVLGELVDVNVLERELSEFAVARGAVHLVDVSDERKGARLVPLVEREEGWKEIVDRFNAQQPGYARLDPPLHVPTLPRTGLGKPDLMVMRELVRQLENR